MMPILLLISLTITSQVLATLCKIQNSKIPNQNYMKSPSLQSFGLRLTSTKELNALSNLLKVTHRAGSDGRLSRLLIDLHLATIDPKASPLAQTNK